MSPLKFLNKEDGVSGGGYIKEQVFNMMKFCVLEANIFQKWLPAYIESFAHNRCPVNICSMGESHTQLYL